MLSGPVRAQFQDALIPDEMAILAPVFAQNTGNYIMDVSGTTYAVHVWDDPNGPFAAMEWKVGTAAGYALIDPLSGVLDPDVCLVKNGAGVVYAIVAYFDVLSNQFKMRVFNWAAGMQQFNGSTPIVLTPGQYGSAISIDANDAGDFALVWDQPGQMIQMAFGQALAGTPPALTFPGTAFNLDAGDMCDLSLYRDAGSSSKVVHVAYRNSGGFIVVDTYTFADLLTGLLTPLQSFRSPAPDLVFRYPRIDSPTSGIGADTDFTVVVEDSDNSGTWYIKGFNSHSCCPGFESYIYNDGITGNSPYNLTDIPNTRPVVTYFNNGDGMTVGWNLDNSFGLLAAPGAAMARQPIALSCDKQANAYPSAYFLSISPIVTTGSQIGILSISGKYSSNALFTYLNTGINNIQYKMVPHVSNAPNLKTVESGSFYHWVESLNRGVDAETHQVTVQTFDVMGRLVFSYTGSVARLMDIWTTFTDSCRAGVYAISGDAGKNENRFSGKIFSAR
jgi:hypothetical protein